MKNRARHLLLVVVAALVGCGGCDGKLGIGGGGGENGANAENSANAQNDGDENSDAFVDDDGEVCEEPSPCGDCDHDCRVDGYKPGEGGGDGGMDDDGFGDGQASGVIETDSGIEVDVQIIEAHYIWIANTGEGTISKIDTRTYEEVGRYVSGPDGVGNDPSRTSVNSYADVFVGNRRGLSVTKISSLGEDCPDTNLDGQVTTSSGPNDVLPWGQDDCVLWNKRLVDGDIIRAVAAHDVVSVRDSSAPVVQPSVWIGGWDGVAWKLHGDTGDVLLRTTTPVRPYGYALDGSGNLWISTREQAFGRIDTTRCTDDASCNVQVCGDDGDDCVKQRIELESVPYGITVDHKQRIWLGGDALVRYDPEKPLGSRLTYVRGPGSSIWLHGVQADLEGGIWGAARGEGAIRFDSEDPTSYTVVDGTRGSSSKGIAVDLDGKVWSINQSSDDAHVVTPGQNLGDNPVVHTQTGLVEPYTYSDMTGSQLRFATNQTGFFRRTFGGCDGTSGTDWLELRWDADVPQDTSITFVARAAPSINELRATNWIGVAATPPDQSPQELGPILQANGMEGMRYLEVEAQLQAVRLPGGGHKTPTLKALEVTYHCGPDDNDGGDDTNNGTGGNNSNNGSSNNGPGPDECAPIGNGCVVDDDCCAGGVCAQGSCITQ